MDFAAASRAGLGETVSFTRTQPCRDVGPSETWERVGIKGVRDQGIKAQGSSTCPELPRFQRSREIGSSLRHRAEEAGGGRGRAGEAELGRHRQRAGPRAAHHLLASSQTAVLLSATLGGALCGFAACVGPGQPATVRRISSGSGCDGVSAGLTSSESPSARGPSRCQRQRRGSFAQRPLWTCHFGRSIRQP